MSLSLRDELRVVLLPDQVLLVRIGRKFTLQGLRYRVLEKISLPCAAVAGDDAIWSEAINTLEKQLPDLARGIAYAKVILSNHFMHYAMVPWSEVLSNEQEEMAFARHCFSRIYGAAAETWELRLSQDSAGAPQLASAVDIRLLEALRAMFARAKVELKSVQPYLMAAYNNCRNNLQKQDAWFVLFEAGNLCIALLQQGRCRSVRTLKVGSDWRNTLPLILEREAYLADLDTATNQVFLWAPEHREAAVPESGLWKINVLRPMVRPSFVAEYDGRYAMAMSA